MSTNPIVPLRIISHIARANPARMSL